MDLCMQMYGEYHILTSRLYINIGIVYEDNNNFKKAYEYFKKWARVSEEILGPEHPKTLRAKGVLRETRYRTIAREMGEWNEDDTDDNLDDDDDDDEETENPDLEHNYDDQVGQNNNQQLIMDNSMIQENLGQSSGIEVAPDVDSDNSDVVLNGYFEHEGDQPASGSGSDRENSDNENFYDDNFEDYDEHYMFADTGPIIDEYNVNILHDDDDDDDDEIIAMAARDLNSVAFNSISHRQQDNRYANDSHESSGSSPDSMV